MAIAATGGGRAVNLAGPEALSEQVGAHTYRVSPASFFQVNTRMAGALVEQVMQGLALRGSESVLDLYCGVGLFTLPISRLAGRVVGVEADVGAAGDARANLAGRENADVVSAGVEQALAGAQSLAGSWDRVVIDPPRAGVERSALMRIAHLGAPRLVYVSCDPATLARDARLLLDAGYELRRAQPLDLFPHTRHVETVALFTLPGV
jgi:23S rRNA (uracil1939-C5)-methyltransferase